jgi:hypothetical protein
LSRLGTRCGTGKDSDQLLLVPNALLQNSTIAQAHDVKDVFDAVAASSETSATLAVLSTLDPNMHVGVELAGPRVCGGQIIFPGMTILFLFKPTAQRDALALQAGVMLRVGTTAMMISKPASEGFALFENTWCVYTTDKPKPVANETTVPSPTPLPSPTPNALPLLKPASIDLSVTKTQLENTIIALNVTGITKRQTLLAIPYTMGDINAEVAVTVTVV